MARVRAAVLLLLAVVLQCSMSTAAVEFEKLPVVKTLPRPGVRIKADGAYCKPLDIFVMVGGYFNVGRRSYLPGDFWLYSFANETWTDLGRRYSQLGVSPGQQFGGTITTIESVTTHCQFLVHGGKTTDRCKSGNFGNTFLVDVRSSGGEYIVSQRLLDVQGGPNAFAQEAVYFDNSVYFVGGTTECEYSRKRRVLYYIFRPGLFRYDVARNSWEKLQTTGPDPSSRVEHLFTLYDKPGDPQLILHGGHDNHNFLSDMWSLSLTSSKWTRLREGGPKITTSIADMHIRGDLVYIFGGWQVAASGSPVKSSSVVLTKLGENSNYGCDVQGKRSSFCEMKVANSIGARLYYVSALRQDRLVVFGGGDASDSNLYALNLTKPQVKALVIQPSVEATPYAMLHIAFVVGISICLLITFTAVIQRVLFRRRRDGSQGASGDESNQTTSAGVSENDLKALPIVTFGGKPAAPTVLSLNEVNFSKDDLGGVELAILDLEKGQGSKDSMDASSSSGDWTESSGASTEASGEQKSPKQSTSQPPEPVAKAEAEASAGAGTGVKKDSTEATTEACSHGKGGDKVVDFGDMCAICICDYDVGDQLRVLPCNHAFHLACVDTWLKLSKACPMCKQDIVIG